MGSVKEQLLALGQRLSALAQEHELDEAWSIRAELIGIACSRDVAALREQPEDRGVVGTSDLPQGRDRGLEYRVVDSRALLKWQGIPVKVYGAVGTHPENWRLIEDSDIYPKESALASAQAREEELRSLYNLEKASANHWFTEANQSHNDAIRWRDRAERLAKAVQKYGNHTTECATNNTIHNPCTCGFNELIIK